MDPKQPKDQQEQDAAEKDQQQHQQAKSPAREGKAVFRTIGLNEEPDEVKYRSIATAAPPALGTMGGLNFGHMHMGPGVGMPAPLTMQAGGKAKSGLGGAKKADAAPSFGVRVDKTNYVGVSPRDLPPPPFRLEMHTHFHVKGEAIQRVCSVVGRKLCELDTDFEFKANKCKWKVEYRRPNGLQRVNLNVVMFKANKEYIVEVQRREGDITALMQLYAELKSFFKRNQLLCDKGQSSAGTKRPAPKSLPKTIMTAEAARDAVTSVKGLLSSKFVDVQMQGVLAAISLSTEEESRSAMAALVPQLVVLGQSKNANVARLVSVALSRLCDHPECRQAFVRSEGWQFIVKCAAGGADVQPEVQRESLHVVECLCPLYHDELAKIEGAAQVLQLVQDWQNIEDPRLKKHACNAHKALQEAGVLA
ncbi:TPA: hypothetical protein N0F65_006783 [Lagenidium giganteum]|uniref:Uncharacterized protein n=1 Tax=Lagenidium giganteum TaxID=4803 RepID=A0AAV2ZDZ4_9STRA|nr:TPA: hypothetical protein N0F65_006783 [Lagenidium giganteum]